MEIQSVRTDALIGGKASLHVLLVDFQIMVTALAVMAALIGVMLGRRFKVFILALAIHLDAAIVGIIGFISGNSSWSISTAVLLTIAALQFGYFAGTAIRFFTRKKARRQRSARKHCGSMKAARTTLQT